VTSDYELLLVITLSETRFITRISSEPVPYFHVPHRLTRPLSSSSVLRTMPRTPAFRHRYRTGSGYESLTPKKMTYAVTVDAYNTPDAIAKVKNLASGRHLETIRSPISHRNRTFFGDASPLNAVRDRCDIRNMAAIERLEGHIEELKQHQRESTLRMD
jgi:hypothetical protein